jgi:hypothetical protein
VSVLIPSTTGLKKLKQTEVTKKNFAKEYNIWKSTYTEKKTAEIISGKSYVLNPAYQQQQRVRRRLLQLRASPADLYR